MTDLVIPDVSEFQGVIDWGRLTAACPAVIMRLHNGTRLDNYAVANRAGAHAHGVHALGLYQYLPAAVSPASAANAFCDAVGVLRPGEWPILDLEEGSGDQSGRAHTWYATVAARLHDGPAEELYSGEYFFGAHNLAAAGFARIWVAAYGSGEPGIAHELWQFTDARAFPGISGSTDASLFHGSIIDLLFHTLSEDTMAQPLWINGSVTPGTAPAVVLVPAGDAWAAFTHRTLHLGMDEPGVAGAHAAVRVAVHKGGADWDRVETVAVTGKGGTVPVDITGAVKVSLETASPGVAYSVEVW